MNLQHTIQLYAKGKKFRRALKAGVSEHEALQAKAEKQLKTIFNKADKGKIDAEEFTNQFQRKLVTAYEDAFRTGKGEERLSNKDRRWINSLAAEQFDYLKGFADAIDAGDPSATADRAALYGRSVKAAYWKGALSEFDSPIDWILSMNIHNCDDCIELADGSPYDPEDLPTMPGQGDTACLGNCGCTLVAIS